MLASPRRSRWWRELRHLQSRDGVCDGDNDTFAKPALRHAIAEKVVSTLNALTNGLALGGTEAYRTVDILCTSAMCISWTMRWNVCCTNFCNLRQQGKLQRLCPTTACLAGQVSEICCSITAAQPNSVAHLLGAES